MSDIILVEIKKEMGEQLANAEVSKMLLQTTFKGLSESAMLMAIQEGMIRGFKFKDFLERNVYAIPFKEGYSLITSIDHARKIGMRSGIIGKLPPVFEERDGKVFSCTVTVKRKNGKEAGEYSDTVFFSEYYRAGKNGYPSLWDTKPRTMIAKVAEMHALRMACPEELSQAYVEEEMQETKIEALPKFDMEECRAKLTACSSMEKLKEVWSALPMEAKKEFDVLKEDLKMKFENQS